MDWIRLASMTENKYSTHLVNEFYSGILVKKSDLNLSLWNPDLLYTHFNDRDFDFDDNTWAMSLIVRIIIVLQKHPKISTLM